MWMEEQKELGAMNIVTVVSLDGSSKSALKIVMAHTDGSEVTLTTLADITKDGMTFIQSHGLRKMFENSGLLETGANMEIGEKHEQS
jgi:hypothetical protein